MKLKYLKVFGFLFFATCLFQSKDLLIATIYSLGTLRLNFWLLGLFFILLCPCISALRTYILISLSQKHQVYFPNLVSDSLISFGLNSISISGVGEAYRISKLKTYNIPISVGTSIVIIDRLIGISSFFLITVTIFFAGGYDDLEIQLNFTILLIFIFILLIAMYLLRKKIETFLIKKLSTLRPLLRLRTITTKIALILFFLGILTCLFTILGVYFAGLAIAIDLPFTKFLINVPLIAITALFLPLSIGGLGLREIGYVYLLSRYGIPKSESIALGVTQYSTYLFTGILGYVYQLINSKLSS